MYEKLKQIAIPTARVNLNALLTGGPNRTETIKPKFQAPWLLHLPPGSTLKTLQFSHTIYSMFFTIANVNTTDHFPRPYGMTSLLNTYVVSFV
jgi:hypothetical protein